MPWKKLVIAETTYDKKTKSEEDQAFDEIQEIVRTRGNGGLAPLTVGVGKPPATNLKKRTCENCGARLSIYNVDGTMCAPCERAKVEAEIQDLEDTDPNTLSPVRKKK